VEKGRLQGGAQQMESAVLTVSQHTINPHCNGLMGGGRMQSSGILHCVALVRTKLLEKHSTSIIRVTRIGELGMEVLVWNTRLSMQRGVGVAGSYKSHSA
jgi:hypothetical protein